MADYYWNQKLNKATMEYLTWKSLADKISKMSEAEQQEPVKVWGEDLPLSDECVLCKDSEDVCFHPEYLGECYPRSDFEPEHQDGLIVALEAGKYYIFY